MVPGNAAQNIVVVATRKTAICLLMVLPRSVNAASDLC